jgi:hypothetical protein
MHQARAVYLIGRELEMTADVALHLKADDAELMRRLLARAALEHRSDDTSVSRGSSSGAGEFLVLLRMVCELGFLLRLVSRTLAPAAKALAAGMPKSRAGKDGLPWCGSGCPSPGSSRST